MRRLEFARTSWGEEVSSPRVGLCWITSSLPSPSPLYFIHIRVCCVWLSPLNFSIAPAGRHSSFSRGHPSGNARGGNTRACPSSRDYARAYPSRACTFLLPVRFENTKHRLRFSRVVLFFLPFLIARDTYLLLHQIHANIFLLRR